MHSVRPSRSRILFEVFCALAIAASFVGAWMQTGASALLPAAAVAALYGLVHTFDLFRRKADVVAEPQRIDFATDPQADLLIDHDAAAPLAADNSRPAIDKVVEEAEPGEPAAPGAKTVRRTKAPRKNGGGRRASTPKVASVTELTPLEEAEIASIQPEAAEADSPMAVEEVAYPHIEPLFEPEPFVRMPRQAFGRKAG